MKQAIKNFFPFAVCACFFSGLLPSNSAEPEAAASPPAIEVDLYSATDLNEQVELLAEIIKKLELQNEQLRSENQQLRRWLSESNKVSHVAPLANNASTSSGSMDSENDSVELISYWLTGSSGVRHNSRCRYFNTTVGKAATAEEGTPCKICGG